MGMSSPRGEAANPLRSDPEQEASPGMAKDPTRTVLVVDDDASVLRVAAKVLQRGGYDVVKANSGVEALKLADEAEGKLDLLLTDVVMPGMNGRELSEALSARYPDVRVLFMSGYTEDDVILQGVRVADVNFISKPFTVEGLREKVRLLLDQAL